MPEVVAVAGACGGMAAYATGSVLPVAGGLRP